MNLSYRIGWLFFRALYTVYFRWRVFNADRVPVTGGVILAANHASFIDPPLVGAALFRCVHVALTSCLPDQIRDAGFLPEGVFVKRAP